MCSLIVAAALLVPAADEAAAELKKLAGTWTFVVPDNDASAQPFTLEVTGNRFTIVFNEQTKVPLKAVVHAGTNPRCIDFEIEDRKITLEGIYRLEGDTLVICVGEANRKDRPTEFPTESGPGKHVARFKRHKP